MVHYEDDNEFNNEVDTRNVVDEGITFMNEDSVDADAILISLVQNHPYLYNKQLSDFKDNLKKENAWTEIAKILNMKVDECHTRWTRLRERYSREKKQKQEETTTGSGVSKRKTYEFFDNMQFLDPFVKKRRYSTEWRYSICF
ncbi:Transcription factor Adf-1 [Trachymyrmex cornetzi]|uniref:Transcription factor Adf-1 n=1 Tax=Trachymyrmex cornetzi TaxID=471704 RepID=A0A151J225_9HYME|nr:Transcription factor Adf-1 [Trachymyrmex cornetzi]